MPSSNIIAQVVCSGNKMVPGHDKLTSFECATILSAALQLFAIKLPLHLNTNSFQNSKFKFSLWKVIFRTSPSIKCPITSEIICTTSVSLSSAKPVQAFARRKSPLNTAILLPNSISSWYDLLDDEMLDRFTTPVCTKLAATKKKYTVLSQKKSLCFGLEPATCTPLTLGALLVLKPSSQGQATCLRPGHVPGTGIVQ